MPLEHRGFAVSFRSDAFRSDPVTGLPSAVRIIAEIERRYGLGPREIYLSTKAHLVARARQAAYWHLWNTWCVRWAGERRWSKSEIARMFGKHHTTVMYGIEKHERRMIAAALTVRIRGLDWRRVNGTAGLDWEARRCAA